MEDIMLFLVTFTAIGLFVLLGMWDLKKYGCSYGGAADGHNYDGPDSAPTENFAN
ncbi:MAG: hypothetical protein HON65_03160 [Rhodospirillales bacterium]|jgi:hypothetical protein|nr:hypothetical protein [Rhodospirillales bacterium]